MKLLKILPLLTLFTIASCGDKGVKATDLAVQAMERARVAEADVYAPKEYQIAENLFQEMNDAIEANNKKQANELAIQVVDAANKATEIAKQNKATTLIAKLKKALATAEEVGVAEEYADVYAQANQSLIDAENFYQTPDFEKSIEAANSGLDSLEPLIGGSESLALANLNRARELLNRAYQTTDLEQTEATLTEASNLIENASVEYQERRYVDSIKNSQKAIDLLNYIIEQYPNDSAISINVDQDANLQLQAYDLLRKLEETLAFIKKEYGVDLMDQEISNSEKRALLIPNSNTEIEEEEVEILLYEDEEDMDDEFINDTNSIEEIALTSLPLEFKSQNMENSELTNTLRSEAVQQTEEKTVTIEMIDELYNSSKTFYEEASYLNSIDASREGLRLAELFLATQVLSNHTVIKGDTLWDISKEYYQTPWLWPNIWRANKLIIKDPDLIYPKQEFRIPPAPTK